MHEASWIPPPEDNIKVNVDDNSFNNPGRWSFGCIFQTNKIAIFAKERSENYFMLPKNLLN